MASWGWIFTLCVRVLAEKGLRYYDRADEVEE